jgi:hypothetical protein
MRFYEFAQPRPQSPSPSTGTIKPKPPMTPAQVRQKSERKTNVGRRISDEQRRHNEKMTDLRDKMSDT